LKNAIQSNPPREQGFLLDEFTTLSPLLTLRVTFSTGC
jgi:hypothetical protein